jgi:hypothetical protein
MPTPLKPLLAVSASLLAVSVGLFLYMTGPANMIRRPRNGAAVGYPMLDGCLAGYTADDVDRRLAAWSPDQVATYRAVHLGPDMLFPWVYAGFFFVTTVLVFRCAFPARALWPWLLLLPLLTLAADYAENYLISFVILPAGPPADAVTVAWASRATVAKWLLVALNAAVLLIGGGLCLRARRTGATPVTAAGRPGG